MITVRQIETNILHYQVTNPTGDVVQELNAVYGQAAQLLKEIDGNYVRIFDASAADVNFSQVVRGMAAARTGGAGSASDPRAITTLYVGPELKVVAKSLSQEQYGRLKAAWHTDFTAAYKQAQRLLKATNETHVA